MASATPPGLDVGGPPPGISAPPEPNHMMHQDFARDIGQQVEQMIEQAKKDSETKVLKEIQNIKVKIEKLAEKLKKAMAKVKQLEAKAPASSGMMKADLERSISKLEQVWEGEVVALKHELWQTIQAHNHNADLMKSHKDTIEKIHVHMESSLPQPELELVHTQLQQVDKVLLNEQARQQKIDMLAHKVTAVQNSLSSLNAVSWAASAGLPMGMGAPMPDFAAVHAASAFQPAAQPKKASAKNTKKSKGGQGAGGGGSSAASMAAQNAMGLRAEAPEFVPCG